MLFSGVAIAGPVLDSVRTTRTLACGVVAEANDETKDDTHGDTAAFGTAICQAVGAAVLGAHPTLTIRRYPAAALAYQALTAGQIALIVGATPDPGLARRYNVDYLHPVFFDSAGLMVHRDRGLGKLADLAGKHICYLPGTDAERRLLDATRAAHLAIAPFPFEEVGELEAALVGGQCDAEIADITKLAAGRAAFHGRTHDFDILPDRLSLDPLSPVIRTNDPEWARVIDWVTAALVQAEISGVTQANAAQQRQNPNSVVQTLTGATRGPQWGLTLRDDWSLQAIQAAGNYGEIFDRTLGTHSALRLDRGPNKPWTEGGLLWGFD